MEKQKNSKNIWWISAVISALLITILYFSLWGFPIPGLPPKNEILSARATLGEQTVNISTEDMELAKNLPRTLHIWFGGDKTMPEAYIIYQLTDGRELVVGADENTIYWNGRYYAPKGSAGTFFHNVVQGLVEDWR